MKDRMPNQRLERIAVSSLYSYLRGRAAQAFGGFALRILVLGTSQMSHQIDYQQSVTQTARHSAPT